MIDRGLIDRTMDDTAGGFPLFFHAKMQTQTLFRVLQLSDLCVCLLRRRFCYYFGFIFGFLYAGDDETLSHKQQRIAMRQATATFGL